ncbi:uncharacterized protein [Dermacentor andersoni]|uniref:uncharacterized protein n=1 Tax=Dermacentor andersoni TaxID=34620 RepID=UPI002155D8F0|nr:uncharacterized protein LOC126518733 [Dermacentor andersoni]
MQKCGCAFYTRELSPSFTTKICSLTQMNDCIAETKDSGHYDHCETACDLACKETEYDARLAGFSKYQGLNETTGKFGLHLSFATSAVEVFLYEPAMKVEEVFGYVGSYQEIWLGISMVSVVFYASRSCKNLLSDPDNTYRTIFSHFWRRPKSNRVISLNVG